MYRATPSVIAPCLLASCLSCVGLRLSAQNSEQDRNSNLTYKFTQQPQQTRLSFEVNANKIYLPVRVNNSGPYWFLLDTGSISNVVDTETAKKLAIRLDRSFEASGGGEKTLRGAIGSNVILRIGDLEIRQGQIDVEPVNGAISAAEGRTVEGLLGYDFLSRFVVHIDYIKRRLEIFEPSGFHYSDSGGSIPLEVLRGEIFVASSLTMPDGKSVLGKFVVDTGWRSALSLASPLVAHEKLLSDFPRGVDAVTGMGMGGPTVDTVARISSLKLGQYTVKHFVANFSHAKAGVLSEDNFAGIIGGEILRRFDVILDYPRQRMMLKPNAAFSTPYNFDMSGLFLVSATGASGGFMVYSVVRDSPATQAGIMEGDLIEEIDGRAASSLTLEQVRHMFGTDEGKQHYLRVDREGKVFAVELTLRKII
jgi:predicted aspartyl protease